jgi:hypothetical protein
MNLRAAMIIVLISIKLCLPVAALAPGIISTGDLIIDDVSGRIGWPITYAYTSGSVYLSQIYLYWPSSTGNLNNITLSDKQVYGVIKTPPFAAITSGLTSIIADKSIYYNQPKTLWFNFQKALQFAGDNVVETVVDSNANGTAEAFYFAATASGTASTFNLYVDSTNTAANIMVGVYTGTSTAPTTLLATGLLTNPLPGAWNAIPISPISITSGSRYWLAVLNPTSGQGTIKFRTKSSGTSKTSSQTNLNSLPNTWTTGSSYSSTIAAFLTAPSSMSTNPSDYRIRLKFYSGEYVGYPSFPTCDLSGPTEFCDASLPWHNASVTNQIAPFTYTYSWKVDSVAKGSTQNIQIDWASLASGTRSLALLYSEKYSSTIIWSKTITASVFNVKKPVPVISIEI